MDVIISREAYLLPRFAHTEREMNSLNIVYTYKSTIYVYDIVGKKNCTHSHKLDTTSHRIASHRARARARARATVCACKNHMNAFCEKYIVHAISDVLHTQQIGSEREGTTLN